MTEHLYTMIIVITYNFISLKTSFLCYYKPSCSRYILHILHGHPSGTHLLILNLNALRDSDSLVSMGTKSHIFWTSIGQQFSATPNRICSPPLKRIVITKVIRAHFLSISTFFKHFNYF